mgnify:CR=1 FL=1
MEERIQLPELGNEDDAPEQVEVSFWYVEEGEEVKEGEDLLEVITDKAAFTVPAPRGGTLKETLRDEAQKVRPGEDIAVIES